MAKKGPSKSRRPPTSEAASSPPSPTFPRFGQLPHEIRHMIWKFALLHPQTVMIATSWLRQSMSLRGVLSRRQPLLHTCQESRCLALPHGPLTLGEILKEGIPNLDLDRDVLFFTDPISFTTFAARLGRYWRPSGFDSTQIVMPEEGLALQRRIKRVAVAGLLRPLSKIKCALDNLPDLESFVCETEDGLTQEVLPGVTVEALSPRAFKRRFYQ